MFKFNSSETRERNAFVENAIEEVSESLRSEAVIYRLGDTATLLADRVDRLYIPNIKNGLVSAPKKYKSTTHIPIIAMYPEEKLMQDKSLATMNPIQESVVRLKMQNWYGEDADYDDAIAAVNTSLQICHPADMSGATKGRDGFVWHSATVRRLVDMIPDKVGKTTNRLFNGRPLIGLIPRADTPQEEVNATFVHELVHTIQADNEPVRNPNKLTSSLYSRELEAYHIASYYGMGLYETPNGKYHGSKSALKQLSIESLRAKHTRLGEPFYANAVLEAALDEAGIDIIGSR
ncbi:MAG: hypothetical protein AAB436_02755 [Patescibacteria group bacterium]